MVVGRRVTLGVLCLACLLSPPGARAESPAPAGVNLAAGAYVDPMASVTGDVEIGRRCFFAPCSSVRAVPGTSVKIGDDSSVQDGAVVVGIADGGLPGGYLKTDTKGVRIGSRTTVGAQAQVQGPARLGDGVFVGMCAFVFNAEVADGCVIEPGAMVMGVRVPPGRYVPASLVVIDQDAADALPKIGEGYPFRRINERMVAVYAAMAEACGRTQRESGRGR